MENNDVEQDKLYEEIDDDLIIEEELEIIHPDLDHNFPYPKMNLFIMSIHHNDTEKIIDYPEDFCQYLS